jgi:pyruvate/2-oxoacid:ferredoxin oxidoreductase beta subunit
MNVAMQTRPPALSEYYSETKCIWCDGCGNYGIWTAVKYALVELNLPFATMSVVTATARTKSRAIASTGSMVASSRLPQARSLQI